jgi:hypothetical protein
LAPKIIDPALYVMAFGPLDPEVTHPDGGLARVWRAASTCGITHEVANSVRPPELPHPLHANEVSGQLIAEKASEGPGAAAAFVVHDVVVVIVRLPPTTPTDDDPFTELSKLWLRAIGDEPMTGVFGVAHVFTGTTAESASKTSTDAADMARAALNAHHGGVGSDLTCVVAPGIALWDRDAPWGRSMIALAEPSHRTMLDDWCWMTTTYDDIGQLARYLMHAMKLRFEYGVFQDGAPRLREVERRLDSGLDQLFAMHAKFETTVPATKQLIDAQSQLSRAQGEAAGLLISITRLRDLRETVDIARENMRRNQPALVDEATSTTSPFERDIRLADWLDQQVRHELNYLDSTRARAAEAQTLTDLRLKQVTATQAETATWVTVLQTSLLATIAGTLTAVATLGGHIDAAKETRATAIPLIGALTLIVPALAARWTARFGWPELAGVAIIGAAAGTFVAIVMLGATSPEVVIPIAALTAALLAAVAYLVNGRRGA